MEAFFETVAEFGAVALGAILGLIAPATWETDFIATATSQKVVAQRVSSCAGASVVTLRVPAANELPMLFTDTAALAVIPLSCPVSATLWTRPVPGLFGPVSQYGFKEISNESDKSKPDWQDSIAKANEFWLQKPACATVAAHHAIGMAGIIPAACVTQAAKGDGHGELVRLPPDAGAVARLVDEFGKTAGTATLISHNELLTAAHIFYGDKPGVRVAQFRYVLGENANADKTRPKASERRLAFNADDTGEPPGLEDLVEYELTLNSDQQVKFSATNSDATLDYAIITIECGKGTLKRCPTRLGIRPIDLRSLPTQKQSPHGRVHLLGFTDNVFFPRGMILSTFGQSNAYRIGLCEGDGFCYDNQTNHGFSGAPVFDDAFKLIGMHTKGLRFSNLREKWEAGQCKVITFDGTEVGPCSSPYGSHPIGTARLNLSLPNRGTRIDSIINDLCNKFWKPKACQLAAAAR